MCCRNCSGLQETPCAERGALRLGRLWGTWSLSKLEERKKGSQSVLFIQSRGSLTHRAYTSVVPPAFPHLLLLPLTGNTSDFICSQNLWVIPLFSPTLFSTLATGTFVPSWVQPSEEDSSKSLSPFVAGFDWLSSEKKSNAYMRRFPCEMFRGG